MHDNRTSFLNEYDEHTAPFAKIGAVTEGSPAERAVSRIDITHLMALNSERTLLIFRV